jgi:V8-like Glu-specific endopeptidase
MLTVLGVDERTPCDQDDFTSTVIGQITARAIDGRFMCTGGLIGPDVVLTAAHCVWDDRAANAPFADLGFAPNQTKVDNRLMAPYGRVMWDYVTLFKVYTDYPDTAGLAYDVAVINLAEDVGNKLGWLGVRAEPHPCQVTPTTLTLAGYPGDDPADPRDDSYVGSCYKDTCVVQLGCSDQMTNHTCDSYTGQSGAPMVDDDSYIRVVHTLGVLPGFSDTNGGVTLTKFLVDNIMVLWRPANMTGKYIPQPSPYA